MCRNYRELSTAEVGEIARLYPVTPNRVIARQYDISVDALQDFLAYPNGWTKDRKAMSRRVPKLTERQEAWIIKHYAHTTVRHRRIDASHAGTEVRTEEDATTAEEDAMERHLPRSHGLQAVRSL